MSTNYYLVDKNKKEEYVKLVNFWENVLFANVTTLIDKFFEENKGQVIDTDLKEDILKSEKITSLKQCPIYDDICSVRLGCATATGFYWDYVSLNWSTMCVSDYETLATYLREHTEYIIVDEYDEIISLEKFKKLLE